LILFALIGSCSSSSKRNLCTTTIVPIGTLFAKIANFGINDDSSNIQRFEKRLSLPDNWKFVVINYEENRTAINQSKQVALKHKQPILELYHVTRHYDPEVVLLPLLRDGFSKEKAQRSGNKGNGIYFANHSRYSFNWGSGYKVLICYVVNDPELVERYRSEIYSPIWDSEYLVKDSKLIFPAYYLHYDVIIPNRSTSDWYNSIKMGYVKHGEFGCSKCDVKNEYGFYRRCDCKFSNIDDRDIIQLT